MTYVLPGVWCELNWNLIRAFACVLVAVNTIVCVLIVVVMSTTWFSPRLMRGEVSRRSFIFKSPPSVLLARKVRRYVVPAVIARFRWKICEALIGTFLPWLSSGSVLRSSYELFDLVERLGFSPNGAVSWALRLWVFAPLLLVLSAVAQGFPSEDRSVRLLRLVLPIIAVVYVGGTAAAVRLAPEAGLFRLRFGVWVTLIGAVTMIVGLLLQGRRRA